MVYDKEKNMTVNHTIWILVASGYEARLFATKKIHNDQWGLIKEYVNPEDRKRDVDLVADKFGSYSNVATSGSSSYTQATDPKEADVDKFAKLLADDINLGRARNAYYKLIVVAPAKFNGMLQKHFDKNTRDLIVSQIDKDYTRLKEHNLIPMLRKHME
jgi:protein required for attachment to host cells